MPEARLQMVRVAAAAQDNRAETLLVTVVVTEATDYVL
jgi:hypothetical protein